MNSDQKMGDQAERARAAMEAAALLDEEPRSARANASKLGSWERDLRAGGMWWSNSTAAILGLPAEYKPSFEAILSRSHPVDRSVLRREMQRCLELCGSFRVEHRIVRSDGTIRRVRHVAAMKTGALGEPLAVHGFLEDITDEARPSSVAPSQRFDPVTRLPDREQFVARLEKALERQQEDGGAVALLHLDIDRFKVVNETMGRSLGDLLLRQFAERMSSCLSNGAFLSRGLREDCDDSLGRLSGDEFVALLAPIDQAEQAARVAKRLLDTLTQPFVVAGQERFLTVSIGIAVQPPDGGDAEELLQHAETALAHAKRAGRKTYRFYAERMNAAVSRRLELETELYYARERNELALAFQPLIEVGQRRMVGAEALVRWRHPRLGEISPNELIPIAEDTGAIVEIGEWVLESACRQMRRWLDSGAPAFELSVNLSAHQLLAGGVPAMVGRILEATRLSPGVLQLELTERGVMEQSREVVDQLEELRRMGVGLAVDDFGAGVSALSCLRQLPLDTLKIDGALIGSIPCDAGGTAIVAAVIAMAHTLRLRVVAEGVETEEQFAFLAAHGCEQVQGFHFSPPVGADELFACLATGVEVAEPESFVA